MSDNVCLLFLYIRMSDRDQWCNLAILSVIVPRPNNSNKIVFYALAKNLRLSYPHTAA